MTVPPTPEELYDATIGDVWRLACCLHGTRPQAEDAVVHAFGVLARGWPLDLAEGRSRLLVLVQHRAGHRAGAMPAA